MTAPFSQRHRIRLRRRGFTLVELMISLVMGLIVAMAAVGLAKTATTTFHEQARSSVTEMAVRTASERLRQDLARISYMSTGNIQSDPKVAHRPGVAPALVSRYGSLATLRGIRINVGDGSSPVATTNNLSPDSIEIVGNLATDDQYTGTIYTGGTGACTQVVRLDPIADAAVYSLSAGDVTDAAGKFTANANVAFRPTNDDYLAQVTDAVGCNHYVPVCSVSVVPNTATSSYLLIGLNPAGQIDPGAPNRAVLYANNSDGSTVANNCGSSELGQVTISPVSRVKWQLLATTQAVLQADTTFEAAGNKFDLVRQRLDWAGNTVAALPPEIIAEYGVDLKFGITYMDPAKPLNTDRITTADMGAAASAATITKVTAAASYTPLDPAPQNVRSVRYRIAVRTSIPDRDANLPIGAPGYLARYCADAACQKWSRVRTVVSEVALHNQAGMSWQ